MNPLETIGSGLRQTATDLGQFSTSRQAYQDAVMRRVDAMRAARLEEEKRAQQIREDKLKADEADRLQKGLNDFRKFQQGEQKAKPAGPPEPYLAPGMGPNGEEMYQPPAEMETVRPSRDQMQQKAFELGVYGDPGVKAYMDDTNPAKTLEGQKELFGIKSDAAAKASAERMKYMQAMEEYRQGRTDARTVMTLKAAMDRAEMSDKSKPKTDSGMPLKALGDTELNNMKNIQSTAFSISKIRTLANNISDLKKGPIVGSFIGNNPYDKDLQALDRLVNQTVPAMARGIFGEVGVLTDDDVKRYKNMLASVKDTPDLARQIMDDLQEKIASAYQVSWDTYNQGGRDVSGFEPGLDFEGIVQGTHRRAPAPVRPPVPGRDPALSGAVDRSVGGVQDGPKEGDTKINPQNRKIIFRGGRWVAA